jgi:hypothetical protein
MLAGAAQHLERAQLLQVFEVHFDRKPLPAAQTLHHGDVRDF